MIHTREELNALPPGAVIQDATGDIFRWSPYREAWMTFGQDDLFSGEDIALPAWRMFTEEPRPKDPGAGKTAPGTGATATAFQLPEADL